MKLTLLQIVRDMLGALDAEDVDSVDDTAEAGMCVRIANRAFEQMATRRWRHFRKYDRLSTTAALNEMTLPTGTIALNPNEVWYAGQRVYYLEPNEFRQVTIGRDTSESNIQEINDIKVYNDRNPRYFTTDDDETLIFDTIPDGSGLQGSDTRVIVYIAPTARLSADGDYFDLPAIAFPALDSLCISMALNELKMDSSAATREYKTYIKQMGSLAANARIIEPPDDRRKWIVPRRSTYHKPTIGTN